MHFRVPLSFLVLLVLSPVEPPLRGEEPPTTSLIEQYQADLSLLSRHVSIAGNSDEALTRQRELLDSWLARVAGLAFETIDHDSQVDAILLRNEIEATALKLEERVGKREDLSSWLPFREGIDALGDARVRGEAMNPEAAAAVLAPVAESISELQKSLKAARGKADKPDEEDPELKTEAAIELPSPHQALMASEAVDDLAARLKQWFENYNGFIPEFSWWVKKPHDEAAKALTDYAKYLREEIAGVKDPKKEGGAGGAPEDEPLLGKAIGPSMLQRHLDHEMIPYTPEELIAMAEREFAWCEEQMREASREMKLGEDWKEAMEQVKLAHVPPGEQETFVKSEARRAIDFLKERKLVTIPPNCELWWGTRMLSLSAQRNMPYAAYSGHDVLIAYANDAMSHEDKIMSMRGNNRHFTRNVVPHELIPGHHLQSYMSARQRPYRRVFSTPFFVEGWALYWEMRLYDLKYQTTPEDRIGALFWRMHRCARIIVTLKFHLGEMTPDEMVTFLTDRVGHEKFGATSEVRRFIKGNYSPLYQCGYMLGGLQLIALHRELVESGKMTDLEFHDAVLTLGPIPIEMVRASLLEQPLTADFKTKWRFGETVPVR